MGGMEVLASTNLLITHPFNNKFQHNYYYKYQRRQKCNQKHACNFVIEFKNDDFRLLKVISNPDWIIPG